MAEVLTFPHFEPHFPREQWTLPAVLAHQVRERGDKPYLSWGHDGPTWTFAEVDTVTNRVANGLADLGVAKGDFVGILLPNCLEFIFAWFALTKLGAIEVGISDAYKGSFLAHPLNLSKARVLITTAELAQRLVEIEGELPHLERLFIVDDPETDGEMPRFTRLKASPFAQLMEGDPTPPGVEVFPSDPAAVLMTSGTTGVSKGVLMPSSQFYFFAEEDVQLMRLTPDDVFMTGFPLFHGNAQFLTVYPALIMGAQVVLYRRFSASTWAARAHLSGATVTNLLGATMAFILSQPPSEHDRALKVRTIYAAPLSPELAPQFIERFGVSDFVDGFGQTEISNIFMTPYGAKRPPGASGVLVDQWFEARLVDPDTGIDVPEGETGELLIRPKAPGVISTEYLGMPEKTVETWRDLWFHTGDGLRRDAQGWYFFVDRVKDALRRRGENISSFEVESGVRSHPAVADCAVVGVRADEAAGEDEVMVFVVLKEGETANPEDICIWSEKELPAFMVPRYIDFVDELPQTATEKVRKKVLREQGVTETTWDRLA
ncbi:MAG: AMP-binding protein [Pseudomonadales bacterium]